MSVNMVITVLVVSLVLVVPVPVNSVQFNSASTECPRSVTESNKLDQNNCISDFILLQQQALYCSKKNRFEILRVFRPINKDHPLAVFIAYKEIFTNSSSQKPLRLPNRQDDRCANVTVEEGGMVWVWIRTPIFLMVRPHILNWLSLRTLFLFHEWEWQQIELEIPRVCEDVRDDYLAMLTKQVRSDSRMV